MIINIEKRSVHTSYDIYKESCSIWKRRGHMRHIDDHDAAPEYFYMLVELLEDMGIDRNYVFSFEARIYAEVDTLERKGHCFVQAVTFDLPLLNMCYVEVNGNLTDAYGKMKDYIKSSINLKRMWVFMYIMFAIYAVVMYYVPGGKSLILPLCILSVLLYGRLRYACVLKKTGEENVE